MSQRIYGFHALNAALSANASEIKELWVNQSRQDKRLSELLRLAKTKKVKVLFLDKKKFEAEFPSEAQGVAALLIGNLIKTKNENDLKEILNQKDGPFLFLVLDVITSPHNLGACLRSADAAGVDAVIAPKDKSVGLNETVSKVACGAAEFVPFVQVTNLARTLDLLKDKGVWVYGAAGEAKNSIYETDLKGSVAIVMGSEEKGLRRLTREHCDGLYKIPMHGHVSSLNVSVATGISLFEALRQKQP